MKLRKLFSFRGKGRKAGREEQLWSPYDEPLYPPDEPPQQISLYPMQASSARQSEALPPPSPAMDPVQASRQRSGLPPPPREGQQDRYAQVAEFMERNLVPSDDEKSFASTISSEQIDELNRRLISLQEIYDKQVEMYANNMEIYGKQVEMYSKNDERLETLSQKITKIADKDSDEELGKVKTGGTATPLSTTLRHHAGVEWKITGYKDTRPYPDHDYFSGLSWVANGKQATQVISAIIPCFNETGPDLDRTIRGFMAQCLLKNWRMEAVIVMDGVDHTDPSMADYLYNMFGVHVNSGNPETDPFLLCPDAETVLVQAANEQESMKRIPMVADSVGGYSLVLKRVNHRKANSQMWWLGAHAASLRCKYTLATDCGTVFAPTTAIRLIKRMNQEPE